MPLDQNIERGQGYLDRLGPGLVLPARRSVSGAHERVGGRGDGRIIDIELECDCAALPANRDGLDDDVEVSAVEKLERHDELRLRLDRDDARAESSEGADAVAHMGTNIEYEVACAHEFAIEAIHGGALGAIAVIDAQRPQHAAPNAPMSAPRNVPRNEP